MRPGRSRRRLLREIVLAALLFGGQGAAAQAGGIEGGAFLLRPIGARAVGTGQAFAANPSGADAPWWNPAGLRSVTERQFVLHHSQDFFATGDAIAAVFPAKRRGVFAIAADLQNFGEQENTSDPGTPSTGTILTRSFVLYGSWAASAGDRFSAGVSLKVAQMRVDCTGPCDFPDEVAQSIAADWGAQVVLGAGRRLVLGAAVRNVALSASDGDSPDDDPLPGRVLIGAHYKYPLPARYAGTGALSLSADIIDGLDLSRPQPRVGAEFAWQGQAFIRGGFVFEAADGGGGGPTIGLGFVRGGLVLDLARAFSGFSADAGQAPTYLSVRVQF